MIKNFFKKQFDRKNFQAGVSLPMIIAAFAIISTGTYYILSVNKRNKVSAARARNTSFAELERRRITAILSNEKVCSLAANFGNVTIASTIPKTSLVNNSASTVLATGTPYYNNVLNLSTIQLKAPTGILTTSGNYTLVLTYQDTSNTGLQYAGKKTTVISIPMFVKVAASKITSCYAKTNNFDVDRLITAACSPASIADGSSMSTLTTDAGIATDCKSDITFSDNTDPLHRNTTCAGNLLLNGFTKSGNNLVFNNVSNCSAYPILSPGNLCTNYTQGDRLYDLSASAFTCATPGTTGRDVDGGSPSLCTTNQMLYRLTDSSTSCASTNLSCAGFGTYYFITSISPATGVSCITAPSTSCGPGKYVDSFNPFHCSDLPVMMGSCGAGSYGYKIYRANNGANGQLVCNSYNTARPCGATTTQDTTFAYAINGNSVSCYQF